MSNSRDDQGCHTLRREAEDRGRASAPENSAPFHDPPLELTFRAAAIVQDFPCDLPEAERKGWRRSNSPNTRYFVFDLNEARPQRKSVMGWLARLF